MASHASDKEIFDLLKSLGIKSYDKGGGFEHIQQSLGLPWAETGDELQQGSTAAAAAAVAVQSHATPNIHTAVPDEPQHHGFACSSHSISGELQRHTNTERHTTRIAKIAARSLKRQTGGDINYRRNRNQYQLLSLLLLLLQQQQLLLLEMLRSNGSKG